MKKISSYAIDHAGDPAFRDKKLVLGVKNCKETMRPKINEGDWVIATLGKNFEINANFYFFKKALKNYNKYLVYAMKVCKKDRNLVYSKYYFFPKQPVLLPKKFWGLVKQGSGHKHCDDARIISEFENWVRAEKKRKAGARFAICSTPHGVELIEIPKDPVKALVGIAKDLDISPEDIKKMRQEDDKLRRKKLGF